MDNTFGIMGNIMVVIFNILLCIDQTVQKVNDLKPKIILCAGSLLYLLICYVQNKRVRALKERLANAEKWHKIAYEDALTGLQNRKAYADRINALEAEKDHSQPIHTVMIDIDHFKNINDTMGHHHGDLMLRRTAECIQDVFQTKNCSVFRIGGDEFAVITSGMTDREIEDSIECLSRNSVDRLGISLSVGSSRVDFGNNKAIELSFEQADRRMYARKIEHAA